MQYRTNPFRGRGVPELQIIATDSLFGSARSVTTSQRSSFPCSLVCGGQRAKGGVGLPRAKQPTLLDAVRRIVVAAFMMMAGALYEEKESSSTMLFSQRKQKRF